ncbi:MAG: F-box protein [Parachlamydiaceae bacterium]
MIQTLARQPYENTVPDVWRKIFSYLNPDELRTVARVCALFYKAINKDCWKAHCHKVFTATLFPDSTDWKNLAYSILFKMIKNECFITRYLENPLGIKIDFHSSSSTETNRLNDCVSDLYLLVYPTNKFSALEIIKYTLDSRSQPRWIKGATASRDHSSLIFLKEDREKVLAAFLQAAKMIQLFHNPLRDYIRKVEAKGSPPLTGCSMAAEAAELRRVSCVTPPVP